MRMEDDACAVADEPADGFRIAPTLMTDHDTKCHWTGLEDPPLGTGRIKIVLGRVELHFVLKTGDRSVAVDDQCGDAQGTIDDAFGAEDDRKVCLRGGSSNGRPGAFK